MYFRLMLRSERKYKVEIFNLCDGRECFLWITFELCGEGVFEYVYLNMFFEIYNRICRKIF